MPQTVVMAAMFLQNFIRCTSVGVNAEGTVDPANVQAAVTDATCLISIMHSNNEVGSLQPIAEIALVARQHKILLHSDAAQSIGKVLLLHPTVSAHFWGLA